MTAYGRHIQTGLKGAGFDPGAIDGKVGKNTLAAFDDLLAAFKALKAAAPLTDLDREMARLVAKQPKAARAIEGIVIHCTAGFWPNDASSIRGMHMTPGWQGARKGWSDIGYHYVVKLNGEVEPGRPEAIVGAHVKEANRGTLGLVYVGGVDANGKPKDTRTAAQTDALMALTRALIAKYPTVEWVQGHNDFTDLKECPSFDVAKDPLGKLA